MELPQRLQTRGGVNSLKFYRQISHLMFDIIIRRWGRWVGYKEGGSEGFWVLIKRCSNADNML